MSDSSPDIYGLIAEASQIQFDAYITVAGAALVFYDYALTFSTEISEIWNSKFTGAQVVFLLTRYSFLVFTVSFGALNFIQNQSLTVGVAGFTLIRRFGKSCLNLEYMPFDPANICDISEKSVYRSHIRVDCRGCPGHCSLSWFFFGARSCQHCVWGQLCSESTVHFSSFSSLRSFFHLPLIFWSLL
ncbi:hypothetical protein BD410DRAFT_449904 [Rickenella mellea]|uniref:DUF6533 domain-containing protein n=1 Tax=Rickenella mellea TaxID=50990 RepID=A0A4Y7PVL8_9AGAM|nr:hypothetical protein BD410DRAFT_449904 [Rickenella mellea]